MRILSIMWSSYLPLLSEAARVLGFELTAYSTKQIKREPGLVSRIASEIGKADLVLLYRTSDDFWEELEQTVLTVKDRMPVVVVGPEPSFSALSNVNPEIVATVYKYILFGGAGNMRNMLDYLLSNLFGETVTFAFPEPLPWRASIIRRSPAFSRPRPTSFPLTGSSSPPPRRLLWASSSRAPTG